MASDKNRTDTVTLNATSRCPATPSQGYSLREPPPRWGLPAAGKKIWEPWQICLPTRLDLFGLLGNGNFAWPLTIAERGRVGIGQAGRLRGIARAKRHRQLYISNGAACKHDGGQQDQKAFRHCCARDRPVMRTGLQEILRMKPITRALLCSYYAVSKEKAGVGWGWIHGQLALTH
jgi:hypothetical protein